MRLFTRRWLRRGFKVVTLDWDFPADPLFITELDCFRNILRFKEVKEVWIRKSASGNTHVRVVLDRPVGWEYTLFMRAYCCDDAKRIKMDIIRYYSGKGVMRLWDYKIQIDAGHKVIRRQAGDWVLVWVRN